MSDAPPRTPADCLSAIIRRVIEILDGLSMYGPFPRLLAQLISGRLQAIQHRFRRIADRVAAGTYVPRRPPTRRPPTARKPRRPDPLPRKFRWLRTLVPQVAGYDGQLESLFRDPDMAALLAAAPGPLHRPLRSLCRMLGVTPPAILDRDKNLSPAKRELDPEQNPSPAQRERVGPVAKRWEGEGPPVTPEPLSPQPHPPAPAIPHACGPPLLLPA